MKKKIEVGGSLRDAAARFVSAWHRAEKGKRVVPEDRVTFVSWSALASVMSDKRHELLRHLHAHPEPGIRALSRALGRDYKRVYEDVKALKLVGLIEESDGTLLADYDQIQTSIRLGDAA
jgi:predicted transcriptional regulator